MRSQVRGLKWIYGGVHLEKHQLHLLVVGADSESMQLSRVSFFQRFGKEEDRQAQLHIESSLQLESYNDKIGHSQRGWVIIANMN